jgi:hypothetical protein
MQRVNKTPPDIHRHRREAIRLLAVAATQRRAGLRFDAWCAIRAARFHDDLARAERFSLPGGRA